VTGLAPKAVDPRGKKFAVVYADLLRHAEKFGTECVLEAVSQRLHHESDVFTMKVRLHAISRRRMNRGDSSPTPTGDDVGIAIDRLSEDELTDHEIADFLGVNVSTVRGHLRPWVSQGEDSPRVARLKAQARTLRDEGLVVSAIADRLGIGDRTVAKYLRAA
jgi:DNA-binding CsgD family transcriptional regulator